MAAALVQGKTWRMFFIRHRQCSVYSLKLSDSCLSWTQEGPSVIALSMLAVTHFWPNQKPRWMSVKSWANEMTVSRWWKLFIPLRGRRWRTYQVAPHGGRVPLCINGPQEAQQQGVAHPLGLMVAAVALPAAVREQQHASFSQFWSFPVWLDQCYSSICTHIMACWIGERSVCTAWWVRRVHAAGQTCPFQL